MAPLHSPLRSREGIEVWREVPIPTPTEGQFLVRSLYLSFDPGFVFGIRPLGWMEDRPSHVPPAAVGEVMRGARSVR
jgi:NADPH-dependent curcumin reductase CurA